ncbi:hypothetical protein SCLCIDRAFT_1177611 [Scleroderma citrinum Foug A]|uniref:Uncharacterized protein n=1 Tax=Scleroderma citrinum Foug A TaxID=1036808 RepID=A0A0C3E2V4_9AGAM|nr:hypothetical protein SCLCIDRAFT_1177611 [Scleroderma citrinum Foug A]
MSWMFFVLGFKFVSMAHLKLFVIRPPSYHPPAPHTWHQKVNFGDSGSSGSMRLSSLQRQLHYHHKGVVFPKFQEFRDGTDTLDPPNNTLLHPADGGTGFEGAPPRHQVAFTPNPLTSPLHGSATDGKLMVGATLCMPLWDNLSINSAIGMVTGETPQEQRLHVDSAKCVLKAGACGISETEKAA